jgi:hypothetical protein
MTSVMFLEAETKGEMKEFKIELTQDQRYEIVLAELRLTYEDLLALYTARPDLYSKKDLKAAKRMVNYFSLPSDWLE